MISIPIAYGHHEIRLALPRLNLRHEVGVKKPSKAGSDKVLSSALRSLRPELVQNQRVMILCDDYTRPTPRSRVFRALFPKLSTAKSVDFLITTGTHQAQTPGNESILAAAHRYAEMAGLEAFRAFVHDINSAEFVSGGNTSRGTEVQFNYLLEKPEVFIVISDMKPHYFSGYSSPIKHFIPGCCDFAAIENNHSMALDTQASFGRHPLHRKHDRRTNPVAEDQLEGMRLIVKDRPVYALHLITVDSEIHDALFGETFQTQPEMFERVDAYFGARVQPADIAIVTAGGYPDDESLYTAQRALELTAAGVKPGGRVLFLAACENGIGTEKAIKNFYQPLTRPLPDVLKTIEENYVLFTHKPYKFAVMIQNLTELAVKSELSDEVLATAHLVPARDPQVVLNNWLAQSPGASVNIFHHANKLAIYTQDDESDE
ncbi:MAG: lactate racemase domain-containing protein [Lentisphaeria bacterium]|nr:lactate racemase domain-containing protein [Candidatus Neomarinimicrobiota bacterium]MCF7841315.1 lactate racemase domain-containing protein [Lentisphaeria bacterium]